MPQYDDICLIRPEAVAAICGMLTQPGACNAVGYSGLTDPRTAKARFPSSYTKRWQSQPASNKQQCPRDETFEIYFNDTPLLRKIAYLQNENSYTFAYDLMENSSAALFPEDGNGFIHFNQAITANPEGWNPHTNVLCTSDGSAGQRQVWIDTTSGSPTTITIDLLFSPTSATTGGIQLYRYNSGDETFNGLPNGSSSEPGYIPFIAGQTTYTYQPIQSDDYSFAVYGHLEEGILAEGMEISFSGTCSNLGHFPTDGFLNDLYRYARGRVIMLSHDVLVKNGASDLNDQGYISVARLQDNTDWYSMVSSGANSSIFRQVRGLFLSVPDASR
jgi:hypothetical protein